MVVVREPLSTCQGVAYFELLRRATEEERHMADRPPYPGTPRWLWVFGIIGIVVVLLIVIILFIGVGGPGGHTPPIRHGP